MSLFCVAYTTLADLPSAKNLARVLVAEKLAACVNLLPLAASIYSWKGEIQEESEILLVMKTRVSLQSKIMARLPQIHPYELPELIFLPIEGGLEAYLQWLDQETANP